MAYKDEHNVQRFYQNELEKLKPVIGKNIKIKNFEISTKFMKNINTDGYILIDNQYLVLCEFKNNYNFGRNLTDIAITVLQALYYMKEFKEKTALIPQALFIGDEDEYFVVASELIIDFLDNNPDDAFWNNPPHIAYKKCPILLSKLKERLIKYPAYVNVINNGKINRDQLQAISDKLEISFKKKNKIKFNVNSINYGYDIFTKFVLHDASKYSSIQKITLFKGVIMNEKYIYFNKGKSSLILEDDPTFYPVNEKAFFEFKELYQVKYTDLEINELSERILELYSSKDRYNSFTFPKSKSVVKQVHSLMEKSLGSNWKEEYIVWDPRCYSGNLTNGYIFKNLFLSNPIKEELYVLPNKTAKEVFQFDFKNDEIKPKSQGGKIPNELYYFIKNTPEKIIIFTDPEMGNTRQ